MVESCPVHTFRRYEAKRIIHPLSRLGSLPEFSVTGIYQSRVDNFNQQKLNTSVLSNVPSWVLYDNDFSSLV